MQKDDRDNGFDFVPDDAMVDYWDGAGRIVPGPGYYWKGDLLMRPDGTLDSDHTADPLLDGQRRWSPLRIQ